jgi:hypothetical protein
MKTNKLDNNIKQKLKNRTFDPSASAWERLSAQLDDQPRQKRKGWFFYIGAAASALLLVSIGIQLFSDFEDEIEINGVIVNAKIDTNTIDKKIEHFSNEIPEGKVMVKVDKIERKQPEINRKEFIIRSQKKTKKIMITNGTSLKNNKIIVADIDKKRNEHSEKEGDIEENMFKQLPNSRIKINSDDLLFAVTHSSKEVKAYYAEHNLTREDMLRTIKSELKKTNININPNVILAEVERNISEEYFENNFLKSIKKTVSNVANVFAVRNNK